MMWMSTLAASDAADRPLHGPCSDGRHGKVCANGGDPGEMKNSQSHQWNHAPSDEASLMMKCWMGA